MPSGRCSRESLRRRPVFVAAGRPVAARGLTAPRSRRSAPVLTCHTSGGWCASEYGVCGEAGISSRPPTPVTCYDAHDRESTRDLAGRSSPYHGEAPLLTLDVDRCRP